MKKTILLSIIVAALSANTLASAAQRSEGTRAEYRHMHRFAGDVTRSTSRTNRNGDTATRTMSRTRDTENKTLTRQVEGTRFDGSSYSASDVRQKTENGYTRNTVRNHADGTTSARDVEATVDREAGTMSKVVTVTDRNGEQHSHTVERSRQAN